jgi:putative DNA primase/helicase
VKVLALPDGMDLTDWLASDFAGFPNALIHAVTTTPATTSTALALMQRDENLFPLTDLGNARYVAALAAQHGTALRYIEEIGFLVLSNGIWTEDRLERSRALVHESADLVGDIADALMESAGNDQQLQAEARRWKAWAKYCASKRGIDAVLSEIKALPMVATRIEDLDRHHHLLAVRNGVLDLREGVLLEHDPLLLLTKRIDLDYDPTADCPRWVQYLHEVMRGDAVMVDYLQRLVGYGITGETTEQCFSVLWGSGANGKTVFTSTLSEVFEAISVTTPFSTFEQKASGGIPNDLAALRGARLVFAAEGEADKPMAEALLKSLTGRDLVTARFLRKEFFTFRPTFQLMLATNNKPSFKGQDEGLWRRVKLIEWSRYFAPNERDHRLPDVLLGEAQGILAWAVRGSVTWFARGLDDPSPIQHATTEYRSTSDPLSGFLPGVFIADVHAKRVLGKDVFDAYLHWAEAENLKPSEIVTRRKFFSWLEERGIAKRASKGGVAFDGIRRARPSDFPDLEDEVDVERLPPETPLVSGVSVAEGLA